MNRTPAPDRGHDATPGTRRGCENPKCAFCYGGPDQTPAPDLDHELREQLAALAHEQWTGWMRYLYSKCQTGQNGHVRIPREWYDRWLRQQWRTLAAELRRQDFGAAADLVRLCADQLVRVITEARTR